jgi:hypothetical protein
MKDKCSIREVIDRTVDMYADISDFIKRYQDIYNENKDKYVRITVDVLKDQAYSYDDTEYAIIEVRGYRLETDDEYNQRKQKELEKELLTQQKEIETLNNLLREFEERNRNVF